MCATDLTVRVSAKHPRDLVYSARSLEDSDIGARDAALCTLGYNYMMVSSGGDLRQMRDREHLVLLRDATQRVAHLKTDAPTDPGIHLVEYQRRNPVDACQNCFER